MSVLGLIFLKYISDAFEELYAKLKADEANGADPEDKDEYKAENVFFVPQDARWTYLQSKAKQPEIGKFVDDAMDAIEKVADKRGYDYVIDTAAGNMLISPDEHDLMEDVLVELGL